MMMGCVRMQWMLQLGHLVVQRLDLRGELLLHVLTLGFESGRQQPVLNTHQLVVQMHCLDLSFVSTTSRRIAHNQRRIKE